MIKIKCTSFTRVGYRNCVVLPRIEFVLFIGIGWKNPLSISWHFSHNKSQSLLIHKYDEVLKYKQKMFNCHTLYLGDPGVLKLINGYLERGCKIYLIEFSEKLVYTV